MPHPDNQAAGPVGPLRPGGGDVYGRSPSDMCPSYMCAREEWHCEAGEKLARFDRALDFALAKGAIVISPDYRLMPEANGTAILADVEAFWHWVGAELLSLADKESWKGYPNIEQVITIGHSAGGYLAMQSWFLAPSRIKIKAIISISAPLDHKSVLQAQVPGFQDLGMVEKISSREAESFIKNFIAGLEPNSMRTSGDPIEMWMLFASISRQGQIPRLLGFKKDHRLVLSSNFDRVDTMPPCWIIHTSEDSIVPQREGANEPAPWPSYIYARP
ncbi:hypothetical protein MY11210_008228 [Beauveria gryllotalpidicola]